MLGLKFVSIFRGPSKERRQALLCNLNFFKMCIAVNKTQDGHIAITTDEETIAELKKSMFELLKATDLSGLNSECLYFYLVFLEQL